MQDTGLQIGRPLAVADIVILRLVRRGNRKNGCDLIAVQDHMTFAAQHVAQKVPFFGIGALPLIYPLFFQKGTRLVDD